ncbi:hypothetical protein AC578_1384 [Pseudocercospora eumusae]|uniref:Uncharacterized protein n=1 Tax=Pseudocercospora eumusae TaxID=321146 RepID=A0A139HUU0_9PEZI|nr:hypothetical protein AC578_1384 [Pseudocercospora eumusae]
MDPTHMALPSPPPSQPETTATTSTPAVLGPAGSMIWSHLNLIDQLLHDKDRLLRDKDETVRSKTELWRESHDALRKRDEEVNEHRGRVLELERALKGRGEEIDQHKASIRALQAKYASAKSKNRRLAKAFDDYMDRYGPDEDTDEHEHKSAAADPNEDSDNDADEVIELEDEKLDAQHKQLQELWPICNSEREQSASENEPAQKRQRLNSVELDNTRDIPSLLAGVSEKLQALEQTPSEAHEDMREEAAPSSVTMPGSKRKLDQMSESPCGFPIASDTDMPSASANEVSTSVYEAEPSEQGTHAESPIDKQQDLDNGPSLFESPFLRRQAAKLVTLSTGPLIQFSSKVRESTRSSAMALDLTGPPEREEVLEGTQEDDWSTQTSSAAMIKLRDDLLLPMRVTIRPLIQSTTDGTFKLGESNIMADEVLLSIYSTLKKLQDKRTAGNRHLHPLSKKTQPCCHVWLQQGQSNMSWTIDHPRRFACKRCLRIGRACFTWQEGGLWAVLPLLPAARPKGATEADASYYIYQKKASTYTFDDYYELSPCQQSKLKRPLAESNDK